MDNVEFYSSNATVPPGKWVHIAVTFNGEHWRFYINGKLDEQMATKKLPNARQGPVAVGNRSGNTDRPIAGLLADLKRSGLLDETLVIWGGEFGRQPTAEYAKGTGRDHNSFGFTMWMAGGGVKGGISVGETDELGAAAIAPGPGHGNGEKAGYHVKSLHATVLHLLGLDPNRLSYFFGGLDQKLVGVEHVQPIKELLG
jgi:hypothetical protein